MGERKPRSERSQMGLAGPLAGQDSRSEAGRWISCARDCDAANRLQTRKSGPGMDRDHWSEIKTSESMSVVGNSSERLRAVVGKWMKLSTRWSEIQLGGEADLRR